MWNLKSTFSEGLSLIPLMQGQPEEFAVGWMNGVGIAEMEVEHPKLTVCSQSQGVTVFWVAVAAYIF